MQYYTIPAFRGFLNIWIQIYEYNIAVMYVYMYVYYEFKSSVVFNYPFYEYRLSWIDLIFDDIKWFIHLISFIIVYSSSFIDATRWHNSLFHSLCHEQICVAPVRLLHSFGLVSLALSIGLYTWPTVWNSPLLTGLSLGNAWVARNSGLMWPMGISATL